MKVEIWSDVMCPYCYIGKRQFERAMDQFDHAEDIEVIWKSFQLNPGMETQPGKSVTEHLAEVKGWTVEQADQMNRHVTDMASDVGLEYHLDKAVVANSFQAHRFAQYAQSKEKGYEAEEALFRAYFTEGKNTDDIETLVELAEGIGLNPEETRRVLKTDEYANAVKQDMEAAKNLGIRGVPFFLFDRKYAISGARGSDVLLNTLQKVWSEGNKEDKKPAETGAKTEE